MTYDATWPLCIILVIMVICLSFPLPIISKIQVITSSQKKRLSTIDGLRGYLAYLIVFLHATVWYNLVHTHQFKGATGSNIDIIATTGLCVFFMISAFLFWTRWLNHRGKVEIIPFYTKRFFRIAPIYYICIICLLIAVMNKTTWHLNVPVMTLIKQIAAWLSFGLFSFPPINGYGLTSLLVMGVVWTIPYEWMLYLTLPIIGVFSKNKLVSLCFSITLCIITFLAQFHWNIHFIAANDMMPFASYAVGILIATLKQMPCQPKINDFCGSLIMLACIVILLVYCRHYPEPLMLILGGIFFYCVVSGASLFGLFNLSGSQRMGRVSYSIYLCQGLIFYLFSDTITFTKYFMAKSIWYYWVMVTVECLILLFLACLLYIFIEKPFMNLGRKIANRLSSLKNIKHSST